MRKHNYMGIMHCEDCFNEGVKSAEKMAIKDEISSTKILYKMLERSYPMLPKAKRSEI